RSSERACCWRVASAAPFRNQPMNAVHSPPRKSPFSGSARQPRRSTGPERLTRDRGHACGPPQAASDSSNNGAEDPPAVEWETEGQVEDTQNEIDECQVIQ